MSDLIWNVSAGEKVPPVSREETRRVGNQQKLQGVLNLFVAVSVMYEHQ